MKLVVVKNDRKNDNDALDRKEKDVGGRRDIYRRKVGGLR